MPPSSLQSGMEEEEGEFGGEDYVTTNPIGSYHGARNDKNERHGRGRAKLPGTGDIYLGCYYKGLRHGLGIYKYGKGNGARYGGDWVMGQKQGWGTMYYPDGSQYTGNWDKNERHGWGVYVFPNCDEYEGYFYRGIRNGRGIYRTKNTGEKFVGEWIMGKRNGPGMIIRGLQKQKFIGSWHNDIPKGEGVYIFDDLCCEQHGKYTQMKVSEETEERWKNNGFQVFLTRAAPPPLNPLEYEARKANTIIVSSFSRGGEDYGEDGEIAIPPATVAENEGHGEPGVLQNPVLILEEEMKQFIADELAKDVEQVRIIPLWHATKVTQLMTPIPDATVPPPPIPPVPLPPPLPATELEGEDDEEEATEVDDPYMNARRLAQTHALGPVYHGQGVCQDSEVQVKLPPTEEPYARFSKLDLDKLDEVRGALDACGGQLQPLDVDEIMRNAKLKGLEAADKWRECLSSDPNCENPTIPAPPGGNASPPRSQPGSLPPYTTRTSTQGGRSSGGYLPDNDTEPTTDGNETDASYYTTDDGEEEGNSGRL